MKRNGRHRDGAQAKRRRARIARRLKLKRIAFRRAILALRQLETDAFARFYRPFLTPEQIADLTAAAFAG